MIETALEFRRDDIVRRNVVKRYFNFNTTFNWEENINGVLLKFRESRTMLSKNVPIFGAQPWKVF